MSEETRVSADHLESRLEFETLLADLSSRFIDLAPGDVDREIEDALRRVCELLGIDLAVLWQWSSAATGAIVPTHAWCAQGSLRPSEPMREEHYPWTVEQVRAGRKFAISSPEEMPAEAAVDRETCRRFGIKSAVCIPLAVGSRLPMGALGFNALGAPRVWPDALLNRLQLIAQIFANALARRLADEAIRTSEARLAAGADLAGLATYEVDFTARVAVVDDRFREVCGLPGERAEGLGPVEFWMERLHPDDRQRVLDLRDQLHNGTRPQLSVEYRFLHPTRGVRWLHHMARVSSRGAAGNTLKSYGSIRDITERREVEESLRRSYEEIERLNIRLQAETDYLRAEINVVQAHGEITGRSAVIRKVLQKVEQVAPTGSSVLVYGETGTGKELVAQAIHRLSPRRSHVIVKVNCAALPSSLIESELLGREKGAFTGALSRQVGRFEVADGSTIFLDEVGELPLEVQAKLLRVLESGEFERLGSPRTLKVDVRVIAATNRNLEEEVRKGRFREDLYYRLNVFPIRVPPLRERTEDIPQLVWTFLEEFSSRMGKRITQVPRKTMEALRRRPWPGNVRELRNVIEHGAIITTGETLRVAPLDEATPRTTAPVTLADGEREFILRALERAGGHVKGPKGAAAELGLKPSTLYTRMRKLGIRLRGQAEKGST
jgi:formate hydrogenlyase transcriptional activator